MPQKYNDNFYLGGSEWIPDEPSSVSENPLPVGNL